MVNIKKKKKNLAIICQNLCWSVISIFCFAQTGCSVLVLQLNVRVQIFNITVSNGWWYCLCRWNYMWICSTNSILMNLLKLCNSQVKLFDLMNQIDFILSTVVFVSYKNWHFLKVTRFPKVIQLCKLFFMPWRSKKCKVLV